MVSIYTSYSCYRCKKEFVLLTEDLENSKGYLVCPYCSSQKVKQQKATDSLRECMGERTYKRINGALRQVRQD